VNKLSSSTIDAGASQAGRSNAAADEKPSEPVSGLILFAEDNAINQLFIQQQLRQFGHTADIAADGAEAFDKYRRGNYKLLLTDCNMPAMNGFELTRAIRDREKDTGQRLPIIAITGDALQGEAERCLEAGMDDCLVKPVDLEQLGSALEKWLTNPASACDAPDTVTADPFDESNGVSIFEDVDVAKPIDLAVLIQILGTDDQDYLKEIVALFWDTFCDTDTELTDLLDARDACNLRNAAHSAKGASASVGATPVSSLLSELQFAAADADWDRIEILMPKFRSAFAELDLFIKEYSS